LVLISGANDVATAKLAIENKEPLSVAEEWARLTGEEVFDASRETSPQYNGLVLAKAVVIVQTRLRCHSLSRLGKLTGRGRAVMSRHARGLPLRESAFQHAMRDLAVALSEGTAR
jgi:hypothetical protein